MNREQNANRHREIRKAELFTRPIPYRGSQGFFDVPDRVLVDAGIGFEESACTL